MIDLASMVLAPTAVKDGKVYNAIPNDQDFTFSRGTEATRINSAGLIEKARTNFLLQSNSFDTTWTTDNTSVTSGQSGYDGSNDAWRLTKTANQYAKLVQSISNSNLQTYSFYVKADTLDYAIIYIDASTDVAIWIDLTDGSITNTLRDDFVVSKKVEDISNGWYRCSITTNQSVSQVRIFPNDTQTTYGTTSGSIYIQSAQLEQGLVATDVITTTTSSVTVGITDDLPRVDYSGGGCPSLLLEPSRTQLVTQAEYFGAWNNARTIDTDNQATSPEGVVNAAYLEQQSGQTNAGSIYFGVTFPSTSDYTTSIFAKKGEKDFIVAYDKNTDRTYFNLDTGTVGTTPAGVTASIEDFGNGWYRCSATFNTAAGGGNIAWYLGDTDNSSTVTDSGGVYIYGAMLEAGSYSTSYIPSYGTSTSRSADSCSLTNASNLIGQTEGTLFVEMAALSNDLTYRSVGLNSGSATNRLLITFNNVSNNINFLIQVGGVTQVNINYSGADITSNLKIAFAYKENNFVAYVNGSQVGTDTSGSTYTSGTLTTFSFDNAASADKMIGELNQAILFPTRLTNDQLAELTK